ncbi:RMD1 family protein [Dinghuibacter silviterrae]|uniref:Putative Rmd1/YagE family protein n=1 Tax=Dinghuibacter silviterrae TaxID=1539049 RepID=A0A4R8DRM3_9BACT|nr:RMD1 family protein [Dinghuibacter silviterrae]TDX00860.1 putative Rmd1/YagE family protein [Dinghuibacter silviterrae]
MLKVQSYQVADSIDIRSFRSMYKEDIYQFDAAELFYKTGAQSFTYVFKYGVVCFINVDAAGIRAFIEKIAPYSKNLLEAQFSEEFEVDVNAREPRIGYNKIELAGADVQALRLVMLNVSQSVALDYYSELTERLQEETNAHTQVLEKKGKLDISGNNLTRYIAKTLNLKNRISENLYVFDSPPETWEDEQLNKIDQGLKATFDLQERFRDIREGLEIIKENLDLFKDLLQYRNSTFLEWIIIVLVFLEVLNLLIDKIFK